MQQLTGLQRWQNTAKEEAVFAVDPFSYFLPKRKNINLGEVWTVVAPNISRYGQFMVPRYW